MSYMYVRQSAMMVREVDLVWKYYRKQPLSVRLEVGQRTSYPLKTPYSTS